MRNLALALGLTAGLAACDRARGDASADAAAEGPQPTAAGPRDAGGDGVRDRGALVKIAATNQVSVCDVPAWPESNTGARRLGYLRHGAVVEAYESAILNDECKDGWFELADGAGWVCSKYATVDLESPRVRLAPHQPDRDAGMPYTYGVNLSDGTPLYRRVLSETDRKKYEALPKRDDEVKAEDGKADGKRDERPADDEEEKSEKKDDDAVAAVTAQDDETGAVPPPTRKAAEIRDAGAADASREKPKLRDLKGRGVLVRKMSRGFYLALDREFKAAGTKWWRTSFGFAVPFDRIMVQRGVSKHAGNWFEDSPFAEALAGEGDAGADAGPGAAGAVAFVRNHATIKITLSDDGTKVKGSAELPARSAVLLTGNTAKVNGVTFHEAAGGFHVQLAGLTLGHAELPADLAPNEKWIDVDITRQTLIAFEGTRPVFATLISSGRRNLVDKERDFPTPTGTFRIGEKHVTTTMDGDVASDGPYSIEDVPWVMYFQGSYALHGAFWHDNFGHVRSHGCVNLAPEDARTLFNWAEPRLPDGWHGVFAEQDRGTRVVVHEDAPPKKK